MRESKTSRRPVRAGYVLLGFALVLSLTGCKGRQLAGERVARQEVGRVGEVFRPEGRPPPLPALNTNAPLKDFLRYAMLNQPAVAAAYYDWIASVERITTERSLPDPRLTFETDITEMVESVMPGLMQDLPGPGKLRRRGAVATAESQARYHAFARAALQAAYDFKRAYYQWHFLAERIRVTAQTRDLVNDLEQIARTQNEVGKVTLQDVLRAQIEQDRLATELANLEDSRNLLIAQLRAALGVPPGQPDPPWPTQFETTPLDLSAEQLLAAAFARNPRLQAMEAEVRSAAAALDLAYRGRVPDFGVGIEADVKSSPVMVRPQLSVTLPIWRDKIAAEIAAARAGRSAAEARLSAEQIALAVELAEKSFMFREATRNLALLEKSLLPKARLSLEVARSAYLTGKIDFFNLVDAWRTLLEFELSAVEARTQREQLLAEISLLILGEAPPEAPLLPAQPLSSHSPTNSAYAK